MLAYFIETHREAILQRARERVGGRRTPAASDAELLNGVPLFLSQLGDALRLGRSSDVVDHQAIANSSAINGRDLFEMGLSIAQVVHGYGDVCQVVAELVMEQELVIAPDQFRILNLCLDDAIAGAVTEFSHHRERALEAEGTLRLGDLGHELRNTLNTAVLAFESIRRGQVPVAGSTGAMLSRSLNQMRELIDRSLVVVRLEAGQYQSMRFSLAALVEDAEVAATLFAQERQVDMTVETVDPGLVLEADRLSLVSVISNLLHNAIKFTPAGGLVTVTTQVAAGRVSIAIEDACGGLPPGALAELFVPFSQHASDRSGLGLGLSIALKAARACGGDLVVRDLPGKGCVFSLELPLATLTPS